MVALVRNIDIVIAYIFDVLIFRHSYSILSLVGSCLVVCATIGSGLVSILQETKQYKKLSCEMPDSDQSVVVEYTDQPH